MLFLVVLFRHFHIDVPALFSDLFLLVPESAAVLENVENFLAPLVFVFHGAPDEFEGGNSIVGFEESLFDSLVLIGEWFEEQEVFLDLFDMLLDIGAVCRVVVGIGLHGGVLLV